MKLLESSSSLSLVLPYSIYRAEIQRLTVFLTMRVGVCDTVIKSIGLCTSLSMRLVFSVVIFIKDIVQACDLMSGVKSESEVADLSDDLVWS